MRRSRSVSRCFHATVGATGGCRPERRSRRKSRISSPGFQGRLARRVDEVGRDDAVSAADDVTEERGRRGVGRLARDDASVERVAQERPVGGESLAGAPPVVVETIGEDLQSVTLDALAHHRSVLVADLQPGGVVQWQGRMVDHRRDDSRFECHGEREVAGEAQADRAHTGPAALGHCGSGQPSEPDRDRAGAATGEGAELGADAGTADDLLPVGDGGERAVDAEQRRQVDREPRVSNPARQADDVRADAGHLRHQHDGRPGPAT